MSGWGSDIKKLRDCADALEYRLNVISGDIRILSRRYDVANAKAEHADALARHIREMCGVTFEDGSVAGMRQIALCQWCEAAEKTGCPVREWAKTALPRRRA